uniref:Uncharacterized protein n=1 Tax=Lygus hesperus TaxID=30085 RepID=A0A0A9VZZ9_LYGHE
MDVTSRILTILLCVRGLKSTFTYLPDDRGLVFQQQAAQVQERIVHTNPDSDISVEDTNYSENNEQVQGVKCTIGRLFYLTEKGRLMRCDIKKLSAEEKLSSEPDSPHFMLPVLPSFGLAFYAGARQPGTVQNQNMDSYGEIEEKKPVVIKPKPVKIKPFKLKPVLVKPVHKPLEHKHPHLAHHHSNSLLHVTVPGLTVYHQTGLNPVNHEEQLLKEELGWNPAYSLGYPYWYFMPPHREAIIQKLPASAERVLATWSPAEIKNPEQIVSDDLSENEETVRSEIDDNTSLNRTLTDDYRTHIMVIDPSTNSSVESKLDSPVTNATGEVIVERKTVDKPNFVNSTDVKFVKGNTTSSISDTKNRTENTTVPLINEDVAKEVVQERGAELLLSEGPDVIEDATNGEQDAAHIRKIREAPGIPIDTLNDQQNPSSSILDRNTLLNIMSSLKEQYLKNAEPDQRKLIEDAFDRLHCSVRDMKKLDERPSGKKIDGPKKAALKLLAERAQPLIEEPDYYSDAADDVSAEPSFLELLNVATKHKGKQSVESE